MDTLARGSLIAGIALGLVVVAGIGWASAGAPGAPAWMRDRMGATDMHMAEGHGCHGCATTAPGDTPAGVNVAIRDVSYEPPTITARVGETIVWRNLDPFAHTVTSDEGLFDSGLLGEGDSWSIAFDAPGTYAYHCAPHSTQRADGTWEGQTGLIVVES